MTQSCSWKQWTKLDCSHLTENCWVATITTFVAPSVDLMSNQVRWAWAYLHYYFQATDFSSHTFFLTKYICSAIFCKIICQVLFFIEFLFLQVNSHQKYLLILISIKPKLSKIFKAKSCSKYVANTLKVHSNLQGDCLCFEFLLRNFLCRQNGLNTYQTRTKGQIKP